MQDVRPVLHFYKSDLCNSIIRLAEPLKELALDGFWYSYVTPEGGFFQISNFPYNAEVYFCNHLYVHNPFVRSPSHYAHNQVILSTDFPDNQFQEAQNFVDHKCGIKDVLFIYKKEKKGMHLLTYSSTKKNIPLNTIFLNNLPLLHSFSDYFLEEWRPHFPKMDSYMIDVAEAMGPKFFNSDPTLQNLKGKAQPTQLAKKLGFIENQFFQKLTKREFECIKHFLEGKTARQIAKALFLSPRTVEHHLENMKGKLGCSSKLELFEMLQRLNTFTLLDTLF